MLKDSLLTPDQHEQAVRQACQFASEKLLVDKVLPYAAGGRAEAEPVLRRLMSRGMWNAVGSVLGRGVDEKLHSWAVGEACERARDNMFHSYILHHCAEDQLADVLSRSLARGMWRVVGSVLGRGVCEAQRNFAVEVALQTAPESAFLRHVWPQCQLGKSDWFFKELMKRGFTKVANAVCQKFVPDVLCKWAENDTTEPCSHDEFWKVVSSCSNEEYLDFVYEASRRGLSQAVLELEKRLKWDTGLCKVLSFAVIQILGRKRRTEMLALSEQEADVGHLGEQLKSVHDDVISFLKTHRDSDRKNDSFQRAFQDRLNAWSRQLTQCFQAQEMNQRSMIMSLETFIQKYNHAERDASTDGTLLVILCSVPLFVDVQSESLRMLLEDIRDKQRSHEEAVDFNDPHRRRPSMHTDHEHWSIISKACLSGVCEQLRRDLFQAAVELKQWSVVRRWADHTLYDDQRSWALAEAFKEKQWGVLLRLADHGLTESEARRAHYRVAKYAGWTLARQAFKRGADVTEIRELLEGTFHDKLIRQFVKNKQLREDGLEGQSEDPEVAELRNRGLQLAILEQKLRRASRSFGAALKQGKWRIVLYRVIQNRSQEDLRLALEAATEQEAWLTVSRLVTLGMDADQRDALFPEMVGQQQWGVCRELLDTGLNAAMCVAALPELMKQNQWTLVARVMEYEVGDAVRRQVLQSALDRREGSVVWQALASMTARVSEQDRQDIFRHARTHRMWQAMKPLAEEKDSTGIAHRDAAMLKALEDHQWDVVDHCERFDADINTKDSDGHTALQRAARLADNEGVRAIVTRGGDQFLLDADGDSVLHVASRGKHWTTVRTLVQFQPAGP